MEIQVTSPKVTQDYDGNIEISFCVSQGYRHAVRKAYERLKAYPLIDLKADKHRGKRSLTANAYAWVLIGKIADELRAAKDEIYQTMLKRYGQCGIASIRDQDKSHFERSYKYHEAAGESELNGERFTHYRFWVGSSQYDSREMAILIDGIVSEAKELDIETLPPEQLAELIERWEV